MHKLMLGDASVMFFGDRNRLKDGTFGYLLCPRSRKALGARIAGKLLSWFFC
jgi:hypothetical protein